VEGKVERKKRECWNKESEEGRKTIERRAGG
jgi:hypothetical protein